MKEPKQDFRFYEIKAKTLSLKLMDDYNIQTQSLYLYMYSFIEEAKEQGYKKEKVLTYIKSSGEGFLPFENINIPAKVYRDDYELAKVDKFVIAIVDCYVEMITHILF